MCAIDGQPVVVAVYSFSKSTACDGTPPVFGEIAASDNLEWIKTKLREEVYHPAQIPRNLRCMKNNYSGELARSSVDRIIGGEEAAKHTWPWIVRLLITFDGLSTISRCGGTILDEKERVFNLHGVKYSPIFTTS